MLRVVADNFAWISLGAFAAASALLIISSSNRRRRSTPSGGRVPGLLSGLTSGVISGALIAYANAAIASAAGVPSTREGFYLNQVFVPFVFFGSVVFLGVLDVFAIWPPRPGDRPAAVGRAVLGVFLVVIGGRVVVGNAYAAVDAAATHEATAAQQSLQDAVDARAIAVTMSIDVIDAEFAGRTTNARIVSNLTLDVTVHSSADIE